jgi:hypothetical protein
MPPALEPPDPPPSIIVRFSTASLPDLPLTLPPPPPDDERGQPTPTTAAALAQRIRARLPAASPAARARLRLVHAGRVLAPRAPLPRAVVAGRPRAARPGFVLCAVGGPLSPAELAEEARRAALPAEAPDGAEREAEAGGGEPPPPPPLGFDALLAQGVPRAEVERMRGDLAAAAAARPSSPAGARSAGDPAAARAREERWLASAGRPAALPLGAGDDADGWDWDAPDRGRDAAAARALDDAVAGALAGFLWPPAAWVGARGGAADGGEGGGVWSRRGRVAALAGLLANLLFAVFRALSARWEGT